MNMLKLFALLSAGLAFALASATASIQLNPEDGPEEILAAIEAELGTTCENVSTRRIAEAVIKLARENPDRVPEIVSVAISCNPAAAIVVTYELSRLFPEQAAEIAGAAARNNPDLALAVGRAAATASPGQASSIRAAIVSNVPGVNQNGLDLAINEGAQLGLTGLEAILPELDDVIFDSDANNPSPSGL